MKSNILIAISNIVLDDTFELKSFYENRNRANSMGKALEEYIKDIFGGTKAENNEGKRLEILEETFSYMGNQNNPPDSIIRGGDAIEVKKIESYGSSIALNSSYPKAKLYSNSPMITTTCRECEKWEEKDIIYVVGVVPKINGEEGKKLRSLVMVYGEDYAADCSIYEKIKNVIREGIISIPNVEFSETKELGRVNKVDPLGITYLRIRGMWGIDNPMNVFNYIKQINTENEFELIVIINERKYLSFPEEERKKFEDLLNKVTKLEMKDVKIKDPNNPAQLKKAKLITFEREKI
jgi:hypothetical protein